METTVSYLHNAWYVAAWADELPPGQLLARRLLDQGVVMFRDSQGHPRALADRCPHRFAPLSKGMLRDGGSVLRCGYHGLAFNGEGRCVHNPHSEGRIPPLAQVRAYPLIERWSALWIWMGDAGQADPARIPEFPFMDPEHWYVGRDSLMIDANYVLESDNILDLSHIEYLHPDTLAAGHAGDGKTLVTQEGNTVWSRRFIRNEILAPFLYQAIGIPQDTPCDRWLDVRWDAPALMWLQTDIGPSGQPREASVQTPQAHLFTPASESCTHYFFSICFPKTMGPAGADIARQLVAALRGPFLNEDKPMVEAQQRSLGRESFWEAKPLLMDIDLPAVRARRVLDQLIATEQQAVATREQDAAAGIG
jgi:phenylpropionate dioxygenase-like ring-hydroxylating dioxygenase large terminal subunit